MSNNTLFPIFLKTETAQFLIVGGGNVGFEKTETLLKQNSKINITIVATFFHPKLEEIISQNENIISYERAFEENDLQNKDFVIITTDKPEINLEVRELAKSKGIKVNAADQPHLCDFYLGSIVTKGNLKIAISTNGKSPVLARRMREYFTEVIPDNIEDNINDLNQFRNNHKGNFQEKLADLNKITAGFQKNKKQKNAKKYKQLAFILAISFAMLFIGYGLSTIVSISDVKFGFSNIPNEFYGMLLIGFLAPISRWRSRFRLWRNLCHKYDVVGN